MSKEISTSIIINATVDQVWSVLMQTENYPDWNPFIRSISGEIKEKGKLKINANGMTFLPTIVSLIHQKELTWQGKLLIRGLLDGRHSFIIKPLSNSKVEFIHKETFSGILVRSLWKKLNTETRDGFIAMNKALKQKCES